LYFGFIDPEHENKPYFCFQGNSAGTPLYTPLFVCIILQNNPWTQKQKKKSNNNNAGTNDTSERGILLTE